MKRKSHDQAPGWAWMLFGLSIGLAVALVVYLRSGDIDVPSIAGRLAAEQAAPIAAPEPATPPEQADTEEAQSSGPASAATELEFYELLPELEVTFNNIQRNSGPADESERKYTIQAGAFSTYAEADGRQAMLALLSIESHIEPAIVNDQTWHRVIIGPLTGGSQVDRVQQQLRERRIEYLPPRPVAQ